MLIGVFWKILLFFTAVILIIYGFTPSATLGYLAKLLAIDFGASILLVLIYPHIRGVKKGDKVVVVDETTPLASFSKVFVMLGISNGRALDDGKMNSIIKVELLDGSIALGRITKYESFLSNAEVKILERSVPIEIKG